MKIAVFGREGRALPQCDTIAQISIVEVDPIGHTVQHIASLAPPVDGDAMVAWLGQQAVEIVLASGICRRDRDSLERSGIQVIVGVPHFRFEPVIAQFLAGTLQTKNNACEEPGNPPRLEP